MNKTITKTTSMNIRFDDATRRKLQEFANQLGMPATTLVIANVKQMLRIGEVRLTTTLEPTPYLKTILREVDKDLKTNRNLSGPFDSAESMIADLER